LYFHWSLNCWIFFIVHTFTITYSEIKINKENNHKKDNEYKKMDKEN
jgi:hypothetical protein